MKFKSIRELQSCKGLAYGIRDFLAGLETPPTTNENVIARLEAELADLNGKIKRLKAFDDKHYNGGEFIGDIDGDNYEAQHRAIVSQLSHMLSYARAIEWRLEILQDLRTGNETA